MVSVQRHIAVLRSALQEGEAERLWIRAERIEQGHSGALLLSDRRLLFSGLGFINQSQEGWPLRVLSGVRVEGDVLEVRIVGRPERFRGKAKDLERLAAALPQEEAEADASVVEGLERLVRLRDSGALTATEFEGAKRRLLE